LQVAFKEAAANDAATTVADVEALTLKYYETLISLHNSLGISLEDTSRGGRDVRGGAPSRGPTGASLEGQPFELDGVQWRDFRAAKIEGRVNPKHPDFKNSGGESVWMYDKTGSDNPTAIPLVAAADLVAAMA